MPPFAAAIVAGILSNVGSDAARGVARRVRGSFGRRALGEPSRGLGPPRQTPTPRVVLTPPVSGYPVPGPADRPLSPAGLADRLRR